MRQRVIIQDIEDMRRQQGIEDVELREEVRGLGVGDLVRLTFLTGAGPFAGETLLVRITSIRGPGYRGKLASGPAPTGQLRLRVGALVTFTAAHIHSLPTGQSARRREGDS
jgi:hypothetical protein